MFPKGQGPGSPGRRPSKALASKKPTTRPHSGGQEGLVFVFPSPCPTETPHSESLDFILRQEALSLEARPGSYVV